MGYPDRNYEPRIKWSSPRIPSVFRCVWQAIFKTPTRTLPIWLDYPNNKELVTSIRTNLLAISDWITDLARVYQWEHQDRSHPTLPITRGSSSAVLKKKIWDLRLYMDYCGLNKITQKNCYPIPLISDLLDAPKKARVYTKIDLRNTYHLVHIAEGNEWKTAFWTHYRFFK